MSEQVKTEEKVGIGGYIALIFAIVFFSGMLAGVLDAMGIEYEILSDTEANIYGKISLTQLIMALQKAGCEVITSREQDESLESYFINLIGGEKHV